MLSLYEIFTHVSSLFFPAQLRVNSALCGAALCAGRQLLSVPKCSLFWAPFLAPQSLAILFSWSILMGGSGVQWSFSVWSQHPVLGAHVGGLCFSVQQEGSCFGQSGSTDPTELMLSGQLSWHGWTWDHLESLLASRWKTKSGEDIPGMVCGTTEVEKSPAWAGKREKAGWTGAQICAG